MYEAAQVLRLKGRLEGDELVQHAAQAPNVGLRAPPGGAEEEGVEAAVEGFQAGPCGPCALRMTARGALGAHLE